MSEDFRKFLEGFSKNVNSFLVPEEGEIGEMVSVGALGLWAWKKIRKDILNTCNEDEAEGRRDDKIQNMLSGRYVPIGGMFVYWQIAIGCLGKKSIEHKIKQLSEKK